jgi:RHS repeat-associated protein
MTTRLARLRRDRLTSVTKPSYTAAYTYAADGIRLRVQESNAQYPDRWLQYDGARPVLEGTLSGDAFTTTAKYVWEGNTHSTSSGQAYYSPLIYSMLGGTWRYHLYDGLGSTRQLLQHLSPYAVTDTYSYEAFGNLMASTGTTPNPYRYVGSLGYYQTGSSLMHLGARYYMPEVGRFTRRDPVEVAGANAYAYAANGPTASIDPSGLLTICWKAYGHTDTFITYKQTPWYSMECEAEAAGGKVIQGGLWEKGRLHYSILLELWHFVVYMHDVCLTISACGISRWVGPDYRWGEFTVPNPIGMDVRWEHLAGGFIVKIESGDKAAGEVKIKCDWPQREPK